MILAIVIPYYKLVFFEATLQSLAAQTDKRFKVYIGNDSSPEDPLALLDKYQGQFDFVYYKFKENLGGISLVQQWHRCIDFIQDEEWVMVLGDDDVLGENVIEEFHAFINQKKEGVYLIRFNLRIIDKNGQLQSDDFEHKAHESDTDLLARMFLMKETITASEFVFSRKVYEDNNGFVDFPLAWFSDYATWLVFSKQTGIYHLKKASVYWRLSGINISSKSTTLRETELKVKSLFLFMSFLQVHFSIETDKQKQYTYAQLTTLLDNLTFIQIIKILGKHLFTTQFLLAEAIIIEFVFKKIKRKTIRIYESICTTSKG
jgi:glycosyltransferase involved in cell wall biosynthesis